MLLNYLYTFVFNIFLVFNTFYLHNKYWILASSIYNMEIKKILTSSLQLPVSNAGGPQQLYLFCLHFSCCKVNLSFLHKTQLWTIVFYVKFIVIYIVKIAYFSYSIQCNVMIITIIKAMVIITVMINDNKNNSFYFGFLYLRLLFFGFIYLF